MSLAAFSVPIGSQAAIGQPSSVEAVHQAVLFDVSGLSPNNYWAVGDRPIDHGFDQRSYAEHWDGKAWRSIPIPKPKYSSNDVLTGVKAISADDVWAVGFAQPNFVEEAPFASHWDGRRWTDAYLKIPKGATDSEAVDVDATSATDVWAVGDFGSVRATQPLIEHRDGSHWSIAPPAAHQAKKAALTGVRAISEDDVWAVGQKVVGRKLAPISEHYDGTAWQVVPTPTPPGSAAAGLYGVAGDSSRDVWAVGATSGGQSHPVIEHWNGSRWQIVAANAPSDDMQPRSVAVVAHDDVWVVGADHRDNSVFLHWDGSSFQPVSVDLNDRYAAIAFTSTSDGMAVGLNVAHRAGDPIVTPAHARWNGHSWQQQP